MFVAVVGLGKLGAPLLAVLATKHDVIGVDTNEETVNKLNSGMSPVIEPRLQELLTTNRNRYRATTDFAEVANTSVTFVIVPTPSDQQTARFSTRYVEQAVAQIGKAIKTKKSPHLVVIVSTVMPGATLGPIAGALRIQAGWTVPVVYSPEFIALGDVVNGLLYPDMILIGADDQRSGDILEDLLLSVTLKDAPVARVSIAEAELAKLFVNCYLTTKLSFGNTMAEVCESVDGVDAQNVARAVGLDSRIGSKFLQPATSYAGPCLPRDGKALLAFVRGIQACAPITEATIDVNERQVGRVANLLEKVTPYGDPIGILGTAYKANTPIIDESIGVSLAAEMVSRGFPVVVFDPWAMRETRRHLKMGVTYATSVKNLLGQVSSVVIAQPCEQFRGAAAKLGEIPVVDLWNLLESSETLRPGIYKWGLK